MQNFEEIKKLLNNSNTYYLISVDMESKYAYVNKRYKDAFDGIYGNLVGKHYSITMHADDLKICQSVSEQCFKNPESMVPAVIRKHDGKGGYITTQWEYKAMFDQNNVPQGIFCFGNDITAFTQTSMDLEDATKSLKDVKFTLHQIAYIQSHGVRKPIANILGLMILLETMEMDSSVKEIFSMIDSSAKELDQLIKNLAFKV